MSDGDGNYGPDEKCNVWALQDLDVIGTEFETQAAYDILSVAGTKFSGSEGPQRVVLYKGTGLKWTSDGGISGSGFKVCVVPGE